MVNANDQPPQRFRIDLVGPEGRVASSYRTNREAEAIQAFAVIAQTDFGKDLGRGSSVALVDRELRLDAGRVAEGHGVYRMWFLKDEGRAAYEAIQPSPPRMRYPVARSASAVDRKPSRVSAEPSRPSPAEPFDRSTGDRQGTPDTPVVASNEIAAHRAQPEDDAKTAALRRQLVDELTTSNKVGAQPSRSDAEVDRKGVDATRDVLGRASAPELLSYVAAQKRSPEAVQKVLGDARTRIESELETPPGTKRRLPPVEDRFNVVVGTGNRTYQFRDQAGKVAFTERWLSMTTALDSVAVIKAMVDRAEERGWTGMRLTGSEEFRRQAWIAADARGIKAVGHEPTDGDRKASEQERSRLAREEPTRATLETATGGTMTREGARAPAGPLSRSEPRESTDKSVRGTPGTAYATVMAELERAMELKGVPEAKRVGARIAVQKALDGFARQDKVAMVKLSDPAASRQTPRAFPDHKLQKEAPDRMR